MVCVYKFELFVIKLNFIVSEERRGSERERLADPEMRAHIKELFWALFRSCSCGKNSNYGFVECCSVGELLAETIIFGIK
jgi:hypothetical protein